MRHSTDGIKGILKICIKAVKSVRSQGILQIWIKEQFRLDLRYTADYVTIHGAIQKISMYITDII